MGRLICPPGLSVDIEDRLLAHLRVVMMNKLRRGESFMLQVPAGGAGYNSIWISPSMAIALQFYGGRQPALDRELLDDMMRAANGPDGLALSSRVANG